MKLRMKGNQYVGEWKQIWYLRDDYPPTLNGKPMTEERAEILREGEQAGLPTRQIGKWRKSKKPVFRAI